MSAQQNECMFRIFNAESGINTTQTYCAGDQKNSQIHRNTFILNLHLLTLNVCGLRSKLLLVEFIDFMKSYDVIYMCETRCDDVDMKMVKKNLMT